MPHLAQRAATTSGAVEEAGSNALLLDSPLSRAAAAWLAAMDTQRDLRLDASSRLQDDEAATALAEALARSQGLTSLSLAHTGITDAGVAALAAAMAPHRSLTRLSVSENGAVGSAGIAALGGVLESNTSKLKALCLDVRRESITGEGCKALKAGLAANSTLQTLDLTGNGLGNVGVGDLEPALRNNTVLQQLRLDMNGLGPAGGQTMRSLLQGHSRLIRLQLAGNSLGCQGAKALADALVTNTTLQFLDLNENDLRDEGAQGIADALKRGKNQTLRWLSLACNNVGQLGATALLSCQALLSLDLYGNLIGDEGAMTMAPALATHPKLQRLDVRVNSIDVAGAEALQTALAINRTLKKLLISGNIIPHSVLQHLAATEPRMKCD
jgi:Ran GTPase-activating protein (RanGAP) involved in mRNA processing and transport